MKLVLMGVVGAGLIVPTTASAGKAAHPFSAVSPARSGGISEIASCGKTGVSGIRVQFVNAVTRPVENHYFLSRLAH